MQICLNYRGQRVQGISAEGFTPPQPSEESITTGNICYFKLQKEQMNHYNNKEFKLLKTSKVLWILAMDKQRFLVFLTTETPKPF